MNSVSIKISCQFFLQNMWEYIFFRWKFRLASQGAGLKKPKKTSLTASNYIRFTWDWGSHGGFRRRRLHLCKGIWKTPISTVIVLSTQAFTFADLTTQLELHTFGWQGIITKHHCMQSTVRSSICFRKLLGSDVRTLALLFHGFRQPTLPRCFCGKFTTSGPWLRSRWIIWHRGCHFRLAVSPCKNEA